MLAVVAGSTYHPPLPDQRYGGLRIAGQALDEAIQVLLTFQFEGA
jgi:hypothetical protein